MVDMWSLVAALSLGAGAIVGGLAAFRKEQLWARLFVAVRVASVAALAVALAGRVLTLGWWSAYDWEMSLLTLVLSLLIVHSVLAWFLKAENPGPLVELVGLGLLLVVFVGASVGVPLLTCPQWLAPFQLQWILFLVGGGSLLVAGCMGLTVILYSAVQRRGRSLYLAPSEDLYALLVRAAVLALVTLGSGLTVSLWWAWHTLGTLTGGDPRAEWMALTWLLTAMSLLAGQLDRHRQRWVIALAVVAASNLLFGWLFLVGVQDLLGF